MMLGALPQNPPGDFLKKVPRPLKNFSLFGKYLPHGKLPLRTTPKPPQTAP